MNANLPSFLSRRAWLGSFASIASALAKPADPAPQPSPPLRVQLIGGKPFDVHRQTGQVVLLDFMTTGCPSCREASLGIQQLYARYEQKGFLAVAIVLDPNAESVVPLYREHYKLTFPAGTLPREEVLRYLALPANKPMLLPTLLLLDRRSRVVNRFVGWPGMEPIQTGIAALLASR